MSYPNLAALSAQVEGQLLKVSYELARSPLRSASQLNVTVHELTDPKAPEAAVGEVLLS